MADENAPKSRFDPEFCESKCPVCTRARRGSGLAKALQRIELLVMPNGCPWGKARQAKYGVKPDEPIPSEADES